MTDPAMDLDGLRKAAEAAQGPFHSVAEMESALATFDDVTDPTAVLALLARIEAAERERDGLADLLRKWRPFLPSLVNAQVYTKFGMEIDAALAALARPGGGEDG
jgi:hypothetical protein